LQGFIRKIDYDGVVSYVPDEDMTSNMKDIINLIGDKLILKGSEIEMKLLSGKDQFDEVMAYFQTCFSKGIFIMTLGDSGSLVIKCDENMLKIPAFKPRIVADETGAGDVYLAIFMYELINSKMTWEEVKHSAYLASAAASFLVEKKGPNGFETMKNVVKRVNQKNYTRD
jgi:sugar/nucleoside kinase (ribokinase family)